MGLLSPCTVDNWLFVACEILTFSFIEFCLVDKIVAISFPQKVSQNCENEDLYFLSEKPIKMSLSVNWKIIFFIQRNIFKPCKWAFQEDYYFITWVQLLSLIPHNKINSRLTPASFESTPSCFHLVSDVLVVEPYLLCFYFYVSLFDQTQNKSRLFVTLIRIGA